MNKVLSMLLMLATALGNLSAEDSLPATAAASEASAVSEEGTSARRVRWTDVDVDPLPAPMEKLAKAGVDIYKQQCLVCHGPEGRGDGPAADILSTRPRNFTSGQFKFKTSASGQMPFDDDLYRTVSSGVPASGMPSFGDLTAFERWALVAHVKSLSKIKLEDDDAPFNFFVGHPAKTRLTLPPVPDKSRIDVARGGQLFRDAGAAGCVKCHGEKGLGDAPSAAELKDVDGRPIRPADLTRGEVTFKWGSRPEDVFRTLTVGMTGTPMPSFDALPEPDRWNLAFYVVSLYRPIDPGEKTFLRVGCTSCHSVGKGKIIGPDLVGVMQRRDRAWLQQWLKDPPTMLATDAAARKLLEEYLTPMPSYGLTDKEVDLLIEYLATLPPAPGTAPPVTSAPK